MMNERSDLYQYLLLLGDNSMIIGHRLSELCGHGPNLETDIALTNISLDFFGQVRSYFQYAAQISNNNTTEDDIAFLRTERDYYNSILVEQENTDFAYVIVRQFLYDIYHMELLEQLVHSKDTTIAAIAVKSLKECKYHVRFSSEWLKRLGNGTAVSNAKAQKALEDLYVFAHELVTETEVEKTMKEIGIGANLVQIADNYWSIVNKTIEQAGLVVPQLAPRISWGKKGMHSEKLGYILSDLQYMQRAYPNMEW